MINLEAKGFRAFGVNTPSHPVTRSTKMTANTNLQQTLSNFGVPSRGGAGTEPQNQ